MAADRRISPVPHYYIVMGRAAEIARALGSPVGGAEHLFLGMLHDGGWPVSAIAGLADPAQAEAAVITLLNEPGYTPPPPPRGGPRNGYVWMCGADVAFELGDSYLGLDHALLSMIRSPTSIPARALAGLADLGATEAAIMAARNAPSPGPPAGAVFLPEGQHMDAALRHAIIAVLPDDATFGYSQTSSGSGSSHSTGSASTSSDSTGSTGSTGSDSTGDHSGNQRTWMHVIGPDGTTDPAVTRQVLQTALASLDQPSPAG